MNAPRYVRPMGTTEIFRSAFELYRQHFLTLIIVNAFVVVPLLLSSLTSSSIVQLVIFPFALIASYFGLAVTTVAASNAVLGRPVSVGGTFRRTFSARLIWRLLDVGLGVAVRIGIGFVLLIIPGIVLSVWYLFFSPVIVLEKITAQSAVLKRSRELVQGHFWRVLFVYGILFYIPYVVISSVIGSLVLFLGLAIGLDVLLVQLVNLVLDGLWGLVAAPIGSLLGTLLYYDLRARKENYNEELLAQDMGYKPLGEMVTV